MSLPERLRVKRGETGYTFEATLTGKSTEEAMSLVPIGSDHWSGDVVITRPGSKVPVISGPLTDISEESVGETRGKVTFTFASGDEYIRRGEYEIEVTMTDPNGRVHKFPKHAGEVFGILEMMDSKDTTPVP